MVKIRKAKKTDAKTIHDLLYALAVYEKLQHKFKLTENKVKKVFFSSGTVARTLIAEVNGKPSAVAVYFYNFSSFLACKGIYLEDLFVLPEYRGFGVGKKLFVHIANIAKKEKCARFEWSVLDWNTPALKFYKKLGAKPLKNWQVHRLDGKALKNLK
ncbi:MAG: hypothetical protein A4S09_07460 [Proteobacteria bacterium SG_bin7]|nr:MAG: hypothetical protein A4S09_07460 [Proteobacteria bacterium SG_bin7]